MQSPPPKPHCKQFIDDSPAWSGCRICSKQSNREIERKDAPNCGPKKSLNEKSNDSEHSDTNPAASEPSFPGPLSGPGPPNRVCRDSESSTPRRITSQFTFELKHILRDARKMSSNFSNQIFQHAMDSCNFQRSRSRLFAIQCAAVARSRRIGASNGAFR